MSSSSKRNTERYNFPIIGVTGSIASGKSTLADELQRFGADIIDADQLARTVIEPNTECFKMTVEHFGPAIVSDGKLDRSALAKIVFSNETQRLWLERLLHPKIRALFVSQLFALSLTDPQPSLVAYVAPLLFEAGVPDMINTVVLVTADRDILIKRAVARGLSANEATSRLQRQMPDAEKRELAHIVIENNGTLAELSTKAKLLYQSIVSDHKDAAAKEPK